MCKYIHCLYFSYHLIISQDFTFCKAKHRKKIIFLIISFFSVFNFILLATCICFFYCVWCFRCSISTSPNCTSFERNGRANTARGPDDDVADQCARVARAVHAEHASVVATPTVRRQHPRKGTACYTTIRTV